MNVKIKLVPLLLLIARLDIIHARGGRSKDCVSDFSVESTTSTKVRLIWDSVCDDVRTYKVHYSHTGYEACTDGRKDNQRGAGFGTLETTESQVELEDLHSFSNYTIELTVLLAENKRRGRPEKHSLKATTKFSIPKAKATISPIDYSYKNTATKLFFNWGPPLKASQCQLFKSHLGSYVYIWKGMDPWNRDQSGEEILDLTQTHAEIRGLEPYSNYMFFLYITNTANEYDEDVYLKLEGRTLATKPDPPVLKTVVSEGEHIVHLEWLPAYPRKGELSHYELRWTRETKDVLRTTWLDSQRVELSDALCSRDHPEQGTACHTVTDLEQGRYVFQIRTYNHGEDPSEWSEKFRVEINEGGEAQTNWIMIGVVILVIIFITGIVILVVCIFRSKNRRKDVKSFMQSNLEDFRAPIIRGNSRFSDTSSYMLRPPSYKLETPPRSAQGPLPPLPTENIYSDLTPKEESCPFLKPSEPTTNQNNLELDDDHYLRPNTLDVAVNPGPNKQEDDKQKMARAHSKDSLDEEGYLKPNFNRFQRMNTSESEGVQFPGGEEPTVSPCIPPVSYMSSGKPSQV